MRFLIRKACIALTAAAGIVAGSLGVVALTPTVAQAAIVPHTQHGCPAYAFCIYKQGGGWQDNKPLHWSFPAARPGKYIYYTYNLPALHGTHRVFNNGGSNATSFEYAWLATGRDGKGTAYMIKTGEILDVHEMKPWHSIAVDHFA